MKLFDKLPPEYAAPLATLEKTLAGRDELVRLQNEAKAAEPAAVRSAEEAAEALEAAEVELACATDENFQGLTERRDEALAKLELAQANIQTIRRKLRGVAAKMIDADAAVESAKSDWDSCQFRRELETRYRRYRAAAAASFVQALRLGFAIENAFPRSLGSVLREVKVRDFGPLPGRPMPCLIDGDRAWLDEANPSGTDLRQFDNGDPNIAALHALLQPIGRAERAATDAMTAITRERDRQAAQKPYQRPRAPSAADAEHARVQKMSQAEFREYQAERADAQRLYPAFQPQSFTVQR